jgi:thioredoxin reductase (NADPH)
MLDCLIIGGGPAGLTAAIYLARYHLSVLIADDGKSRADLIPVSRNLAGFPKGISGSDLLSRMRSQAALYSVDHIRERVIGLERENGQFVALTEHRKIRSNTVLLATGVVNRRPEMSPDTHDEALRKGLLRYCPICDGYEITDQAVAVIGNTPHAANEAEFIRSYTEDVTLISPNTNNIDESLSGKLERSAVKFLKGPIKFAIDGDHLSVKLPSGSHRYRALYPALGSDVRSELGVGLGAIVSPEGCFTVDVHQATSVEGLYAAGDVIKGLDQIASAIGHGSVAATAIRNFVATKRSILRRSHGTADIGSAEP